MSQKEVIIRINRRRTEMTLYACPPRYCFLYQSSELRPSKFSIGAMKAAV
jgi:hypothetical protein